MHCTVRGHRQTSKGTNFQKNQRKTKKVTQGDRDMEKEEEEGGLNDAVSVYPPYFFYKPVKNSWHIWKQQSFRRAEEEVMLTGTNFLQEQK